MSGKIGRPRSCECGVCIKCKRREYMRRWYQKKTLEERREIIASRDPEKTRATDRARYYRHRQERKDRMREYAAAHPEETRRAKAEWAARNPEKRKAQWAVNNAVRDGKLERQPCEACGAKAQAHHDDYSKPLDVRWLCTEHHGEHHRKYK